MKNDYIELFGLPASGKSYYSNNVLQDYINYNEKFIYAKSRVIRNVKKIILLFYMMFFKFKIFKKSLIFINKLDVSQKKKIKMILYLESTLAIINFANNSRKKVCVEEGLLQVLWGVCYLDFENADTIIENFKNLFNDYFTVNVIHVKTDITTIKKRLLERKNNGGSELEHDIEKDNDVIEKAIMIEKKIVSEFNNIKFNLVKGL